VSGIGGGREASCAVPKKQCAHQTRDGSLVAGWGNLVNRAATLIAKNFGEIPTAGPLEEGDVALLARVEETFTAVGDLIGRHRAYPVITGDYSGVRAWRRTPVAVGASVAKPTLVFTKLDPSVVNEKLARLA
jgi:hypothetical protein